MKAFLVWLLITPIFASGAMVTGIVTIKGETVPTPRTNQIEFKVAFDWEFKTMSQDKDSWPGIIHCAWRNTSTSAIPVLLKDHDAYHGALDYPVGIQLRITSKGGRVLTANRQYPDGWWDFSCWASQYSDLMPGDIVTLNPGEIVVRRFKLDDVLAGLTSTQAAETAHVLPDGSKDLRNRTYSPFQFPEGDSTIEVKLHDLVAMNALTLQVKRKANKSGAANGSQPIHSTINQTPPTAGSRR